MDGEQVLPGALQALDEPAPGAIPLVRLHSDCLTGDAFRSACCD